MDIDNSREDIDFIVRYISKEGTIRTTQVSFCEDISDALEYVGGIIYHFQNEQDGAVLELVEILNKNSTEECFFRWVNYGKV